MRQSHLHAVVDVRLDGDQAAHVGFLDGVGIRDPPQRRHLERFSDGQCVDHLADGRATAHRSGIRSVRPIPSAWSARRSTASSRSAAEFRPSATSCSTMLRRYRAFPRVSFHSRVAASGSTWPAQRRPSTARRSRRPKAVADPVGRTGRRRHTSYISVGTRSPSRTVSTTLAASRCTIWCRTNVDSSSSRWTSSTPSTTVVPGGADVTGVDHAAHQLKPVSAGGPAHGANAPSGSLRADVVPTAQRGSKAMGRDATTAPPALSGSSRRPAGPLTRIPATPGSRYRGHDGSHLLRAADQRPRHAHIGSLERWHASATVNHRLHLRVVDIADRLPLLRDFRRNRGRAVRCDSAHAPRRPASWSPRWTCLPITASPVHRCR